MNLAYTVGEYYHPVFRWMADYYEVGKQALKPKPILGRPLKLDESQMHPLAQPATDIDDREENIV